MLVEFNEWVSAQGGWVALAGLAVTAGPLAWRAIVRWWAPIPVSRRKRAWELLTRLGKTDPPARVEAHRGTFVDSVQRLAIREEAFDAVRRRFGLFLAACLIVYPLGAALMLALANDPKIAGSREQFAYFGYLVLLMTPIGAFGGFLDARWNKKALATIDEILVAQSVGNDVLARLLINPAEAISHQCVHADRKDLMNGTFKQYLERRGSGIRRFTRSVWGRAVRGPERAHRLRVLIKRDLILRASRTAWQNRNK